MRLIDADNLNKSIEYEFCDVCVYDESGSTIIYDFEEIVNRQPVIDAVPVVRCKDCIYFQQEQVRTSEGTYRNKFQNEGMVSIDVGINIGSHCKRVVDVRVEGFRDGEPTIERTYLWRNEDDFCSRGKRKTDEQGT